MVVLLSLFFMEYFAKQIDLARSCSHSVLLSLHSLGGISSCVGNWAQPSACQLLTQAPAPRRPAFAYENPYVRVLGPSRLS